MRAKIIQQQSTQEYWFEEGCFIREIGNHPDDPHVSIARARVKPGERTCWHRLEGISERYLITEGCATVEVGDLPAAVVGAGDLVLIPPGTKQRIRNDGAGDLVFYAICCPRFSAERYHRIEAADER